MKASKATIKDVTQIHKLVNKYGSRGLMLPRPLSELYENMRDFYVVREEDEVIGCGALHICWSDLLEIKAVAVAEERQRRGVGAAIVEACLKEARDLGAPVVFALTYEPGFFSRFGFSEIDLMQLPRKVWGECQRCPKYPDCDENAMVVKLEPEAEVKW